MQATATGIRSLNPVVRGELAATEAYQQALAKVENSPGAAELRRIHEEHREAANTLRQHIHEHGGQPDHGSGAWGTFVKAVEGGAKIFGKTAALKARKEGEEQGISDYEKALHGVNLQADCKTLISNRLLPQTRAHIPVLDRLMEMK